MSRITNRVLFGLIAVGFVAESFTDNPEPSVLALFIISGFLTFMQGFYPEFWDEFVENHIGIAMAITVAAIGVLGWWLFLTPAVPLATKIGAVVVGVLFYFLLGRTGNKDSNTTLGRIED